MKLAQLLPLRTSRAIMFAMNSFRSIRACLGVSQAQLGDALGMTQGNVSAFEARGQTVLPETARKLIAFAATLGITLTFDHVYGDAALPAPAAAPHETPHPEEARDAA